MIIKVHEILEVIYLNHIQVEETKEQWDVEEFFTQDLVQMACKETDAIMRSDYVWSGAFVDKDGFGYLIIVRTKRNG